MLLDDTRADAPRALWFPRFAVYHLHDTAPGAPLRTPARAGDDDTVRDDGGNLAALLLRLAQSAQDSDRVAWGALNRRVREIAPQVHRLRPTSTEGPGAPNAMVRLDWEDAHGNVFGCHQLSDGTLRSVALLTALLQPPWARPALMAFDEPELGLHPAALATIGAALRSASALGQVLVATQAPALLDEVDPACVVVSDHVDGGTILRRLDAKALHGWLEEYAVSDLWLMNVIGGQP